MLPTAIDIARIKGKGPIVPQYLSKAYADAIRSLHDCAYAHRADEWSSDMAQSVAAATAAASGQHKIAEAIHLLDEEIIRKILAHEW